VFPSLNSTDIVKDENNVDNDVMTVFNSSITRTRRVYNLHYK